MPSNQELDALLQKLGTPKVSQFTRARETTYISQDLSNRARELAEKFEAIQSGSIPFKDAIVVFMNNRLQQKDVFSARRVATAFLARRHCLPERYAGEIVTEKGYYPRIEISTRYAAIYPWDVDKTLLHELCHFPPDCLNHGAKFYWWMKKVGASRHTYELPTKWSPHVYRHDRCGYTRSYSLRFSQELSDKNYCPACMENLIIEPLTFFGSYNYETDSILPASELP